MEISYLHFIENLDKNFKQLQTEYLDFYKAFRSRDTKSFQLLRNEWDMAFNDIHSPGMLIMDALLELEEDGELEKLIKGQLLNNNLGIIEYSKNLLKIQYDFILNEFQNTAIYIIENNYESYTFLERLYDGDKTLTHEEYFKAIQIHFVEVFTIFQNTLYSSYRLFDRYMFIVSNEAQFSGAQVDSEIDHEFIEPINLKYKDEEREEIMKRMYDTLNDEFIESMPFGEFSLYFKSSDIKRKIFWKGTDLELVLLFEGINIGPNLRKINIHNDAKDLLCNTFLNKYGKDFIRKNLNDNIRNSRGKLENRIDDRLITLVVGINEKAK